MIFDTDYGTVPWYEHLACGWAEPVDQQSFNSGFNAGQISAMKYNKEAKAEEYVRGFQAGYNKMRDVQRQVITDLFVTGNV